MKCCTGATLNAVFQVIGKDRRFQKWQEILIDSASLVNLACIMAELDDLWNALNTLPNTTFSMASQVATAALQAVCNITLNNALQVSYQAQRCAFQAAQAAETGISQLSKTVVDLVAATADQAALLTQRQASLVVAFAHEQAAKAAGAIGQFTSDADLHQMNSDCMYGSQSDAAITAPPPVLETWAKTSHDSNAVCSERPHGLAPAAVQVAEAEDSQHFAAECEASNSAMKLAEMALAEAEVKLLVKQVTADIFRNVERVAVTHQLEALYNQLQQSQAQLKSGKKQPGAAASYNAGSLLLPGDLVTSQLASPGPADDVSAGSTAAAGAAVTLLPDDEVVLGIAGDGCCHCCSDSIDANEYVVVEFSEDMEEAAHSPCCHCSPSMHSECLLRLAAAEDAVVDGF